MGEERKPCHSFSWEGWKTKSHSQCYFYLCRQGEDDTGSKSAKPFSKDSFPEEVWVALRVSRFISLKLNMQESHFPQEDFPNNHFAKKSFSPLKYFHCISCSGPSPLQHPNTHTRAHTHTHLHSYWPSN